MKRFFAVSLALILLLAILPLQTFADGVELPIVVLPDNTTEYVWAGDYSACTATFTDASGVFEEEQPSTSEFHDATCEENAYTVYTVSFVSEKFTTQTEKVYDETKPATGHTWGEVTYTWAEDNSTCTATRTCAKDANHTESETVNSASQEKTPAGCAAPGTTTYTATFTNTDFAEQTKDVDDIPATGHTLGEVNYTWSDDNKTCTASATCGTCQEVIEETVNTTSEVTVEPTEEASGVRTYTATFTTNAAFQTQTKDVEEEYQAFVWGDATGDGKVDNKDIVRLKNYLANYDDETGISSNGTTTYTIEPGADATGDGKVDNKDIVRLKNYLANYDDETGISSNGTTVYTLGPAT